jgi:phenylalanyl-tRNA synthetase alpha chain
LGQKYKEVSKYPSIIRDISFLVNNTFVPNDYFDLIRQTIGEDLIEEVRLIDKYEDEQKFGKDKVSYAYRIVYRSLDRTLTNIEVDQMHKNLENKTKEVYLATIR